MSHRDASHAAICGKTAAAAEVSARCLTLFVLPAVRAARFLFSPEMTALFIAVIVFLAKDSCSIEKMRQWRVFLFYRLFFSRFSVREILQDGEKCACVLLEKLYITQSILGR